MSDPRIVAFLCAWCSYSAADQAGAARLPSEPGLRVIRVMCSGRIDPTFVLTALDRGADGVLIAGCHPGDCHYLEGNLKARRRFDLLKRVLADLGIADERVRLEWISASESARFHAVVKTMADDLRRLGPRPELGGAAHG